MTEETFWSLIDQTRSEAGGDLQRHAELLTERLAVLDAAEITAASFRISPAGMGSSVAYA